MRMENVDCGLAKAELYWKKKFENLTSNVVLPVCNDCISEVEESQYSCIIDDINIVNKIGKITKNNDLSLFVLMQTILKVVLLKATDVSDLYVGTPIYMEKDRYYNKMLVLRDSLNDYMTFKEALIKVRDTTQDAYTYQRYPISNIIEQAKEMGAHFFDVILYLNRIHNKEYLNEILDTYNNYIRIEIEEEQGILRLNSVYKKEAFYEGAVESFFSSFVYVTEQVLDNLNIQLKDIRLISKPDIMCNKMRNHLLVPKVDFTESTIIKVFDDIVTKYSDRIAVVFGEERITYQQLYKMVDTVSKSLDDRGVPTRSLIAIYCPKSVELIACILGVLKHGSAYLPIDPDLPMHRVETILLDSKSQTLIMSKELDGSFMKRVSNVENETLVLGKLLCLGIKTQNGALLLESLSDCTLQPMELESELAYVIYTSGTTGKLKGVKVTHQNDLELVLNNAKLFDFSEHDIWTMFHTHSFDFSVWEMYGALLYGGTLVIVNSLIAKDQELFLNLIMKEKVTVLNQVPSSFYRLIDRMQMSNMNEFALRYVILGGEALKVYRLKTWAEQYPNVKIINMYGITETTVHTTFKEITREDIMRGISNIGRALPEVSVYILGKNMEALPLGYVGEICVSGSGVSQGYLNNETLTEERFIDNPYLPDEKLYRSGDLGRILNSYEIEYVGRIDDQVKVRGYRIEIDEIERVLNKHKSIQDAAVILMKDADDSTQLNAYIVKKEAVTVNQIREYISQYLPAYMIPEKFFDIEKIPLTMNGKVDKNEIIKCTARLSLGENLLMPRTETEKRLANIWKRILQIDEVGIDSNFFELGGHSLKAIDLESEINKEFHCSITFIEIFKTPTIKELAKIIDSNHEHSTRKTISKVETREYYHVTYAQRSMYLLNRNSNIGLSYNIVRMCLMEESIDQVRFEDALHKVINKYESLRTSFHIIDGEPMEKVHDNIELPVYYYETESSKLDECIASLVKPFDLDKAPLFAIYIIHISDNGKDLMILNVHHIIADGDSLNILISELLYTYSTGAELGELALQYKDYAEWQHELLESDELKKQEEYWMSVFEDNIPALVMPLDYPRLNVQTFKGEDIIFQFDSNLTRSMNELAVSFNITMNSLLLAIYSVLLYKYTYQKDIVIGSLAGRVNKDIDPIVGLFLNYIPLRYKLDSNDTFVDYVHKANNILLEAYENQDCPFEKIIEKLTDRIDRSRNPLFDTMIVFHNISFDRQDNQGAKDIGIKAEEYRYSTSSSTIDFKIDAALNSNDELEMCLQYNTDLLRNETMNNFAKVFRECATKIVSNPNTRIDDISLEMSPTIPIEQNVTSLNDRASESCTEYVAPRDDLETAIAEAWGKALSVEQVGLYDDFFKLGGHSLSAVIVEVELEMKGIKMNNTDIYVHRTVENLAEYIREKKRED